MIFEPDMVDAILSGRKTVTRRSADDGLCVCRYRSGRTYSVQPGRGRTAVARLRVKSEPRLEKLSEITEEEAILEGFASIAAFRDRWLELRGGEWQIWIEAEIEGRRKLTIGPLVWRIQFILDGIP